MRVVDDHDRVVRVQDHVVVVGDAECGGRHEMGDEAVAAARAAESGVHQRKVVVRVRPADEHAAFAVARHRRHVVVGGAAEIRQVRRRAHDAGRRDRQRRVKRVRAHHSAGEHRPRVFRLHRVNRDRQIRRSRAARQMHRVRPVGGDGAHEVLAAAVDEPRRQDAREVGRDLRHECGAAATCRQAAARQALRRRDAGQEEAVAADGDRIHERPRSAAEIRPVEQAAGRRKLRDEPALGSGRRGRRRLERARDDEIARCRHARDVRVPAGVERQREHILGGRSAVERRVKERGAVCREPGDEAVATAVQLLLERAGRNREIGAARLAGDHRFARRVHGDAERLVLRRAAEIRAVDERVAARRQLGDESLERLAAAAAESIEGAGGRRKIGRHRRARHVSVPCGIDGDAHRAIDAAPAEVRRIHQLRAVGRQLHDEGILRERKPRIGRRQRRVERAGRGRQLC